MVSHPTPSVLYSDTETMEEQSIIHEEEEEDPIVSLERFVSSSDGHFPSKQDSRKDDDSSEDETETSDFNKIDYNLMTRDILSSIGDKENHAMSPAHLNTSFISSVVAPRPKTPSSTKQRTPLGLRENDAPQRFSFSERDARDPLAASSPDVVATPGEHQLSPDSLCTPPEIDQRNDAGVQVHSPPKSNDPYAWAYQVWRAHGLMGRHKCDEPVATVVKSIQLKTPDSPQQQWDLSPMSTSIRGRRSSTKGVARAEEFARQASSSNFHNLLSSWKKRRSVTPSHKQFDRVVKSPEEFQDLLRKWREARHEMMSSGQERAMEYAKAASSNLHTIMTLWHESHREEFEEWARDHAQSSEEFQDMLRMWREQGHIHITGEKRAAEYAREASSNLNGIMESWHSSQNAEFEDWAREHAKSPEEFQDLLRKWKENRLEFMVSGDRRDSCIPAGSSVSVKELMKSWNEPPDDKFNFEKWAQAHARSPQEFQALLSQWRDNLPFQISGEGGSEDRSAPDICRDIQSGVVSLVASKDTSVENIDLQNLSTPGEFHALLNKWRDNRSALMTGEKRALEFAKEANDVVEELLTMQCRESDTDDTDRGNLPASDEFFELLRKWRTSRVGCSNGQNKVEDVYSSSKLGEILSEWTACQDTHVKAWMTKHHIQSPEDFQSLLEKWRNSMISDPGANPNQEVDEIISRWRESDIRSFKEWAREFVESPDELLDLLSLVRESYPWLVSENDGADERQITKDCDEIIRLVSEPKDIVSPQQDKSHLVAHNKLNEMEYETKATSEGEGDGCYETPVEAESKDLKAIVGGEEIRSEESQSGIKHEQVLQNALLRELLVEANALQTLLILNPSDTNAIEAATTVTEDLDKIVDDDECSDTGEAAAVSKISDEKFDAIVEEFLKSSVSVNFEQWARDYTESSDEFHALMDMWRLTGGKVMKVRFVHKNGMGDEAMEWGPVIRHKHVDTSDDSSDDDCSDTGEASAVSKISDEKFDAIVEEFMKSSVSVNFEQWARDFTESSEEFHALMDMWRLTGGKVMKVRFVHKNGMGDEAMEWGPVIRHKHVDTSDDSSDDDCSDTGEADVKAMDFRRTESIEGIGDESRMDSSNIGSDVNVAFSLNERLNIGDDDDLLSPQFSECASIVYEVATDDTGTLGSPLRLSAEKADDLHDISRKWQEFKATSAPRRFTSLNGLAIDTSYNIDRQSNDSSFEENQSHRDSDMNLVGRESFRDDSGYIEDSSAYFEGLLKNGNAEISTMKRRSVSFARDISVTFQELLIEQNYDYSNKEKEDGVPDVAVKWNELKNQGAEEWSNMTEDPMEETLPNFDPIKNFIAALASKQDPFVKNEDAYVEECEDGVDVSSVQCREAGIEVVPYEVPAGEDPIVAPNGHLRTCACASSIFSGNDQLVEFFLPQLGMACTCGKDPPVFPVPGIADPTAIEHILRPWQCTFLKSFGIHRGDQLVKAHHRSAGVLAKAMKKWRKKYDMPRARTVSCGLALHIWAKVSKIFVRSVRRQLALGVDITTPPNTVAFLTQVLGERRVSVPHTGRRRRSPKELIEPESQVEI